jgi:hypothetical protein
LIFQHQPGAVNPAPGFLVLEAGMRGKMVALLFAALTASASAEALKGKAIEALLDDTTVFSLAGSADVWRQSFSRGGQTIYVDAAGQKTFGLWLVRGDKYCSQWPPSDRWVCYEVDGGQTPDGKPAVTWISGGDGKRYEGFVVSGDHIDAREPPK